MGFLDTFKKQKQSFLTVKNRGMHKDEKDELRVPLKLF